MPSSDLVVATVPGVFPSLASQKRRGLLVFDWMDRWSENARTMGRSRSISVLGGLAQSALWARREHTLTETPNANTFASYEDHLQLGRSGDIWLPTPVSFTTGPGRNGEVRRVGFLANLNYEPNEMSLRWFLTRYGDAFRSRGIEIAVAGFNSQKVSAWGQAVDVLGEVSNVSDFYRQVDAAVVPLMHGGGMKVKAVEALAYGVPVIGTEHVRRGFSPQISSHIWLIEDFLDRPEIPPPVDIELISNTFSVDSFEESIVTLLHKLGRER